jgi:hypothetical protein
VYLKKLGAKIRNARSGGVAGVAKKIGLALVQRLRFKKILYALGA